MSDKDDFTRLDQLGEFLHEEDASLDQLFGLKNKKKSKSSPPPTSEATPLEESHPESTSSEDIQSSSQEQFSEEPVDGHPEARELSSSQEHDQHQESSTSDFSEHSPSSFDSPQDEHQSEDHHFENPSSSDEHQSFSDSHDWSQTEASPSFDESSFSDQNQHHESEEEHSLSEHSFTTDENDLPSEQTTESASDSFSDSSSESLSQSFDGSSDDHDSPDTHSPDASDSSPPPISEKKTPLSVPLSSYQEPIAPTQKENFQQLRTQVTQTSYGKITNGGNPPFSILIKNIKYQEDARDILIYLKEFGLADAKSEPIYQKSMESGQCLVAQIPEFAAIYLVHKIRRFDLDILMGLSDEIKMSSPSKKIDREEHQKINKDSGLLEKRHLFQNRQQAQTQSQEHRVHHYQDIQTSTLSSIPDKQVTQFLGIVHVHKILTHDDLLKLKDWPSSFSSSNISPSINNSSPITKEKNHLIQQVSDQELQRYQESFHDHYQQLLHELKQKAHALTANAIIGLHYQLHPITIHNHQENLKAYELNCIGNAVWVQ